MRRVAERVVHAGGEQQVVVCIAVAQFENAEPALQLAVSPRPGFVEVEEMRDLVLVIAAVRAQRELTGGAVYQQAVKCAQPREYLGEQEPGAETLHVIA